MLVAGRLLVAAGTLLAGQKVFEYFRGADDLRLRQVAGEKSLNIFRVLMRGSWKRVSPRGSRLVDGSKRMNIIVVHWVFIPQWSRVVSVLGKSQEDLLVRNREQVVWLCEAEFAAKTSFKTALQ